MSRRTALLGLGVMGMLATATPAFADGATTQPYPTCANKVVSAADSDKAHTKYLVGRQEYDEFNWPGAIRHFREAYGLDCTKHDLLLIISSAYQSNGDRKEALAALETYVARVPNSPDLPTYQARIENLKKSLQEQPQTATPAPATPAPTAPPPEPPRGHTPYPWIVVGVGAAGVATGIALLASAPSVPANCDHPDNRCLPVGNETAAQLGSDKSTAEKSRNLKAAGFGVLGGGAALVVGGLIWHFLEPTGPKPKAMLSPSVAPGFAGMTVGGAF